MGVQVEGQPIRMDPLERLRIAFGGRPKGQPYRQSPSLHDRSWCTRHHKVCCKIHGKHKRGYPLQRWRGPMPASLKLK
ncbi:MAG: hypothetical protein ACLP9K_04130 [Nitrososphaerales archaeon]